MVSVEWYAYNDLRIRVASLTSGERRVIIIVGEMINGAACRAHQAAVP